MDFFKKYTTPFGYVTDGNQADEYGIDHSGFSTRDEPEYQFARQEREMQLADILNRQGIEQQNYPAKQSRKRLRLRQLQYLSQYREQVKSIYKFFPVS